MHLSRARFKQDIIAEFLPPYLGRPDKASNRVIIFCPGAPGVPSGSQPLRFWSQKGYWVFHPRYRGTWESDGVFLADEPTKDVLDIVDELYSHKPIMSLWDMAEYRCEPRKIFIIGASFGGPAAIFASKDERVKKVVAVSPVIDWRAPSADEPIENFPSMVTRAFGEAYRATPESWQKLQSGEFYNPMLRAAEFDGKKIMIIHAEDDTDIRAREVREFADKTGAKLYMLRHGGHLSLRMITKFWWSRRLEKFFC